MTFFFSVFFGSNKCLPANFLQHFVIHPMERKRHSSIRPLDELKFALVTALQPITELLRIADGSGEQQQADVLGQQAQRQLPHNAALRVVEVVSRHAIRASLSQALSTQPDQESDPTLLDRRPDPVEWELSVCLCPGYRETCGRRRSH